VLTLPVAEVNSPGASAKRGTPLQGARIVRWGLFGSVRTWGVPKYLASLGNGKTHSEMRS
jgi:hypothetical protein